MLKKIGALAVLGFAVANLTGCWYLPVDPFPPTDPPVDPPPCGDTLWHNPGGDTLWHNPGGDTLWHDPGMDTTWHDPGFPPNDSTWIGDTTSVGGRHRRR